MWTLCGLQLPSRHILLLQWEDRQYAALWTLAATWSFRYYRGADSFTIFSMGWGRTSASVPGAPPLLFPFTLLYAELFLTHIFSLLSPSCDTDFMCYPSVTTTLAAGLSCQGGGAIETGWYWTLDSPSCHRGNHCSLPPLLTSIPSTIPNVTDTIQDATTSTILLSCLSNSNLTQLLNILIVFPYFFSKWKKENNDFTHMHSPLSQSNWKLAWRNIRSGRQFVICKLALSVMGLRTVWVIYFSFTIEYTTPL